MWCLSLVMFRRGNDAYWRVISSCWDEQLSTSRWLQFTHHGFYCNWTRLKCLCKNRVFIASFLFGALRSYTSSHRQLIQVFPSKNINTLAFKNQTPSSTEQEDYIFPTWPISPIQPLNHLSMSTTGRWHVSQTTKNVSFQDVLIT